MTSSLVVPAAVGPYELIEKIGQGSMGYVYAAEHSTTCQRVAIKLLREELCDHPKSLKRFQREASTIAQLDSPQIVKFVDFKLTPRPYLVMELLLGRDLRKHLREQGVLTVPEAVDLIVETCQGLGVAHRAGLVHRDLKPENLFLVSGESRPCLKILDFGVAKLRSTRSASVDGELVGTPRYMAPEQVRHGGNHDARTDIYALGTILYECLTGRPPFRDPDPHHLLFRVLNEAPTPPWRHRKAIPEDLAATTLRALSKDPEDRQRTVEQLASELAPFAQEAVSAGRPPASRLTKPKLGRRCVTTESSEDTILSSKDWDTAAERDRQGRRPARRAVAFAIGGVAVLAAGGLGLAYAPFDSHERAAVQATASAPEVAEIVPHREPAGTPNSPGKNNEERALELEHAQSVNGDAGVAVLKVTQSPLQEPTPNTMTSKPPAEPSAASRSHGAPDGQRERHRLIYHLPRFETEDPYR